MTLALDTVPQPDSPLRHLDPRWKLAALLLAAAAVTALQTWPVALAALAGAGLLVLLGRLPWRWYLQRLTTAVVFLALLVLLLPLLLRDPQPLWQWGPLQLSRAGLAVALLVCAKALTLVTLMLVLLASAPLDATFKAAHALHIPGLLVQLAVLTYRYVFLVSGEWRRLRVALRVRGYRSRMDRHTYRTLGHVAGTLLVRGYERAERVGQAMRCRGFDGRFRSLTEFHTTPRDVAAFVLIVAAAAGLLLVDVLCRP